MEDFFLPPLPENVELAEVQDRDGKKLPLQKFLSRYEKIGILSVNPNNAALVIYLSKRFDAKQLLVLCTDDEIDRRFGYFTYLKSNPGAESDARKAFWFPPIAEEAFEAVRRFVIPEQPWKKMLCIGRRNEIEIIPYLYPIKNNILEKPEDLPSTSKSIYNLVFYPKPSLSLEHFKNSIDAFMNGWKASQALRIITFRNDMLTHQIYNNREIRCYPYPIDELHYHQIIASCSGLVIVPRGGLSTIRDAVRYGLDIFSDPFEFSPNRITLTSELGLHLEDFYSVARVDDGYVTSPEIKRSNKSKLEIYESRCIQWFRDEFGVR